MHSVYKLDHSVSVYAYTQTPCIEMMLVYVYKHTHVYVYTRVYELGSLCPGWSSAAFA